MSELSTHTLADLMVKRRKCLTQLRDLGARQAVLIAAGETADLLRLVAAKQQLIVGFGGQSTSTQKNLGLVDAWTLSGDGLKHRSDCLE